MKNSSLSAIIFLLCLSILPVAAQDGEIQLTTSDSVITRSWMVGLGYNFIDDSGDMLDELFSFHTQWNMLPYPSRISFGRYFKSGIGVEAIGTYNQYKVGKIIEGEVNTTKTDYFGMDARLTYDLNKVIGHTAWFDPYIGVGAGYTHAANQSRGTYNGIVGFRTWFSDRFGLDFNSSGKWSMDISKATNHLQHAISLIYQFDTEKELTRQGEKKLALIEAIQKERQRVQDSIDTENRIREEAALAEQLARQREQDLLAQEKAKENLEKQRAQQIEQQIDNLGIVYFDLNSSYLNKTSKTVLERLAKFMHENPTIKLMVSAHTDSRGTSKYNDWLAERRVNRTVEYLIKHGVPLDRLEAESYGEDRLLNECDDDTYCDEEKHRINRRAEFSILNY
ncbi:OmpA family protein [Pareuzebyella sediminis]|uniref:OmpA family protein n=1 Tax=Pareuzebyella sediminis TaxID=2607998 RepID=UPI0011EE2572|nr:OmpA family protein [Pareuzebyella sediminis]